MARWRLIMDMFYTRLVVGSPTYFVLLS